LRSSEHANPLGYSRVHIVVWFGWHVPNLSSVTISHVHEQERHEALRGQGLFSVTFV
jgi:hypothetical protein